MNDDELEQLAQRLGARAAERMDVEVTARAVIERLRAERAAGERIGLWLPRQWLKIAAAVVIVVGAGAIAVRMRGPHGPTATAGADLTGLTTDQLNQVLDAVDQSTGEFDVSTQDVSLDDLNAAELHAVLESLEG